MGKLVCSEEKKRRIGVFVHINTWNGGSYQYVEFILDALADCLDAYEVKVVYVEDGWKEILENSYPFFDKQQVQFNYDRMIRKIDEMGFDYLFMPTYGPDCFFQLSFTTPVISVIHDLMYYYHRGGMWYGKEFSYLYQGQCRHGVGIFVDSEMGKQHCMEALGHMYESKIYVLPFRPPNYLYQEETVPVELKNKKYIFYPAQFFPIKNHYNLLLAVHFLRNKGIYVNLLFTGKGNGVNYDNVCDLIHTFHLEEQIEILAYAGGAEMKYIFSHARAMIMPTYAGPTNIPPIEAMFMGCPVAISDIYAMPEQVGEAGLLFDPASVTDISHALECLWLDDSLCNELSERGKREAKRFSKESFNKRFRESMSTMISKYEAETECLRDLLNTCKKYEKIYLYGAGEIAFLIGYYLLHQRGLCISGFIVSSLSGDQSDLYGIPIYSLEEVKVHLKGSLVILALAEKHHKQIVENLKGTEIAKQYFTNKKHRQEALIYYMRNS